MFSAFPNYLCTDADRERFDRWESWAFNVVLGTRMEDQDSFLAYQVLYALDVAQQEAQHCTDFHERMMHGLDARTLLLQLSKEPPTTNRYEPAGDRRSHVRLRQAVYDYAKMRASDLSLHIQGYEDPQDHWEKFNKRSRILSDWTILCQELPMHDQPPKPPPPIDPVVEARREALRKAAEAFYTDEEVRNAYNQKWGYGVFDRLNAKDQASIRGTLIANYVWANVGKEEPDPLEPAPKPPTTRWGRFKARMCAPSYAQVPNCI